MRTSAATSEPRAVRLALTAAALGFMLLFLVVPLLAVFQQALSRGWWAYLEALREPGAVAALLLTLRVTAIVVPLNIVIGIAAAWSIAKFSFPGRGLLVSLIDLPLAISPVIAGLVFVLVFGRRGVLGAWLESHDITVIFGFPGLVLATLFVTFPFVARSLIPVMQSLGNVEEEAALSLGASGWQTLSRVTLPNAKWGLGSGLILCTARSIGEFGAVSVVSGHIRGRTNTVPLHVETLYNEYNFQAAFAVASILTLLALLTLAAKAVVARREEREREMPDVD